MDAPPPQDLGPRASLVSCPSAPAASADPSRRWAIRLPDGRERFGGVTRPEAQRAIPALAALHGDAWDAALIEVTLPVLLSGGAGPYLLDAEGRITLVLGAHPAIPEAHLAMGEAQPDHRVGLVRRVADGATWEWIAARRVAPGSRVATLDDLDGLTDRAQAERWHNGEHG